MNDQLQNELSKLPFQIRRIYLRLDKDSRAEIHTGFRRHVRACERTECGVDPFWLREALAEARVNLNRETSTR